MSGVAKSQDRVPTGSVWRSIKVIAWSFFGIRKNSESQEDMVRVSPIHIIAAGIAGAIIFVIGLIVLVNWVVAR